MTRPLGSQNHQYAEKRTELLLKVRSSMTKTGAEKLSFSELAHLADVSVPTLRHYFGSRSALVEAVFEDLHREGRRYLDEAASPPTGFAESLQQAAQSILAGVRYGKMDKVHTLGLTEGLGEPALGPAYLNHILEPALQAIEARFAEHQRRGEMILTPVRYAAVAFIAPLLIASLHQKALGGSTVRPMDLDSFATEHVAMFGRAYIATKSRAHKGEKQ